MLFLLQFLLEHLNLVPICIIALQLQIKNLLFLPLFSEFFGFLIDSRLELVFRFWVFEFPLVFSEIAQPVHVKGLKFSLD